MTGACIWKAELTDDTTKELFIAETMYCDGERERAMFKLATQASVRIPAIVKHAGQTKFINPRELASDLQVVIDKMKDRASCDEIKSAVQKVDIKWARKGYQEFAACERGR